MSVPNKACALPFRTRGGSVECLAFRHPLAGFQLVKGTITPQETALAAARRELAEESGRTITGEPAGSLRLQPGPHGAIWHVYTFPAPRSWPDTWTHHCRDDGGHAFQFFWQRLIGPFDHGWAPGYRHVLKACADADLFDILD